MPVHIRTGLGDLRLTLTSDGELIDSQLAATPQEANRIAIRPHRARPGRAP